MSYCIKDDNVMIKGIGKGRDGSERLEVRNQDHGAWSLRLRLQDLSARTRRSEPKVDHESQASKLNISIEAPRLESLEELEDSVASPRALNVMQYGPRNDVTISPDMDAQTTTDTAIRTKTQREGEGGRERERGKKGKKG